jgi:hypothetical protein
MSVFLGLTLANSGQLDSGSKQFFACDSTGSIGGPGRALESNFVGFRGFNGWLCVDSVPIIRIQVKSRASVDDWIFPFSG